MKAQELRIGNLFFDGVSISKVHALDENGINPYHPSDDLHNGDIEYELISEPIPLTEEWLLKFGFEKENEIRFQIKIAEITYYVDHIDSVFYFASYIYAIGKELHMQSVRVKYVHQLQNLYFSLTGTELELAQPKAV